MQHKDSHGNTIFDEPEFDENQYWESEAENAETLLEMQKMTSAQRQAAEENRVQW